jgi:predicted dehydrogenase
VIQQTGGAWGSPASMARVAGTQGTIWTEDGVVRIADRDGIRELPVPGDSRRPEPPGETDDARRRLAHPEPDPFTRLCEVLRAGVEGRTPPRAVPPPTFHDGVACMEVLDAIRASAARDGALVTL